jgi:hypothetical protein
MFPGEHGVAACRMPAVWAHAASTLRQAGRNAGFWVVCLLGLAAGWVGLELSVLALGTADVQAPEMIRSTALATVAVASLWILAGAMEQDRASGFRPSLDCCAPGWRGRLMGRWAGSALAGAVGGLIVSLVLGVGQGQLDQNLSLYITLIVQGALLASWGLLLARLGSGGAIVVGGLLLWLLGHLPFGTPALWPGTMGTLCAAWLPGPRISAPGIASSGLAAGGLLLLALWISDRSESTP